MGYYLLVAIGLIGPFVLIKYREDVGNLIGEADWMRKVGGVYNVVFIVAAVIFFWTLADITGTTNFLFGPLRHLSPAFRPEATSPL